MTRKFWNVDGGSPEADPAADVALTHLGHVLYAISGMPADDRCRALDEALSFYNAARPKNRIEMGSPEADLTQDFATADKEAARKHRLLHPEEYADLSEADAKRLAKIREHIEAAPHPEKEEPFPDFLLRLLDAANATINTLRAELDRLRSSGAD